MKNVLLIILLSITPISFSLDIKWTEIIKKGKRAPAPSVIGQSNNKIYLVRYESKSKPILSAYNTNDLSSIKNTPLVLEYKGKKLDYLGGYIINDKPVIATTFYNKKGKLLYYFAHTINGELNVSPPILLGSVPMFGGQTNLAFVSSNTITADKSIFNVSQNGENAFCLFAQGSKKNPSKLHKSLLLDKSLDKISDNDITLPFLPENFRIVDQSLGNDGRFYIFGYNVVEGKKEGLLKLKSTIYRDDIWLYAIDVQTGALDQIKVDTKVEIEQIGMKLSESGNIFITALTTTDKIGVNGSLCIIYDNGLVEINRTITPFESDFVKTTYSKKELKKQDKKEKKAEKKGKEAPEAQFYDYSLKHIVESKDGSFTAFAEQYYIVVTTTARTDPNSGRTTYTYTYHYYYNDIIAIKYDRDGQYVWKHVIEKRQHSINDNGFYSSFFPIVDANNVGLIFNTKEIENLDQEELSRGEKKAATRKTICMKVTLTSDGEVNKEELFSFSEDEKLAIAPKYSSQALNGDIVIFAKSRKGSKIGVIQL